MATSAALALLVVAAVAASAAAQDTAVAQAQRIQLGEQQAALDIAAPTIANYLAQRVTLGQQQGAPVPAHLQPLVEALRRPINLSVDQATLAQAAAVFSQASGVGVRVAPEAASERRLTVNVRNTPAHSVLPMLVDERAHLIVPAADGLEIRPVPTIEAAGQTEPVVGRFAPWSESLGPWMAPANRFSLAPGQGLVLQAPVIQGFVPMSQHPGLPPGAAAAQQRIAPLSRVVPPTGLPASGGPHITPLGERSFVVSEPGRGRRGEPGLWLTVYTLDESGMVRPSPRVFHESASPGAPALVVPGDTAPVPNPG